MPRLGMPPSAANEQGVRIKQHFVPLAGVGHQPEGATGAQFQMRDLDLVVHATDEQTFVAPVELVRLALLEDQRDKRFIRVLARLLAPRSDVVRHSAVASAIPLGLDLFEQSPARAPRSFGSVRVGLERLIQCRFKRTELSLSRCTPVSGLFLAVGLEALLDRVA